MKEKVLPNSPTLQPIVMGSHSDRSLRLLVTLHLSSKIQKAENPWCTAHFLLFFQFRSQLVKWSCSHLRLVLPHQLIKSR